MTLKASCLLTAATAGTYLLLAAPLARAANPLGICRSGQPYVWPNGGVSIPFNPDQGPLGSLTSAEAVALVEEAFDDWTAVPTATATFVNEGMLPEDVSVTNFFPYMFGTTEGISPIVFDANGEIANLLTGLNSGLLAFGGFSAVDRETCEVLRGRVYLNGVLPFPLKGVVLHELGHFTGLHHSSVNGQIYWWVDPSGPAPFETFGPLPSGDVVEVMGGGYTGPIHRDDATELSNLYPEPGFAASTGTITGRVLAPDTATPINGVNVVARNLENPFEDAVSSLSGSLVDPASTSDPLSGVYRITGLTPGARYALYVDQILFVPTEFRPTAAALAGPEEFWNGPDESNDIATPDDPSEFTPITVLAGSPVEGVDVIFNAPKPGELALGDEGFFQLPLPFPFEICSQTFTSVFVEANGSLTFGRADRIAFGFDLYARAAMLEGPIRVAGFVTDLNGFAGGAITYDVSPHTFRVTWDSVPEFPAFGSNTFSIALKRGSHHVDFDYGDLTATSGLVGVTCGSGATSGFDEETTLRTHPGGRTIDMKNRASVFELFSGDNNLAGYHLRFVNVARGLRDRFEPNDTLARAVRIGTPFETADPRRFSEITPGDVDFFRFRVKAGELLAAEIVRGTFDTLLGLFDARTGEPLAVDDNGGGPGRLSRVLLTMDADRELAIAVSAPPDLEFTGAGESSGRYVLTVSTYRGTPLSLGDDDAVEVPLGFLFPFQGEIWTSAFVNTNGHLTFGAPDTSFEESVEGFLSGPPRIAALWRDLVPRHDGRILVEQKPQAFTLSYVSMPEYRWNSFGSFSSYPNYLSITLYPSGHFRMRWEATTRGEALVGITPGGGAIDPGESDLSRLNRLPASGTIYEIFTFPDGFTYAADGLSDLSFRELEFTPPDKRHHDHPHQHPHEDGAHHHHPHAHPHGPGTNHHHPN